MREQKSGFVMPSSDQLAQLVQRLRPWFLPANVGVVPLAKGGTGGRATVAVNRPPEDQTTQALVGGVLLWRFSTKFNVKPVVHIDAEGVPPTSGGIPAVLYISSIAPNAVQITSTINTDTRVVHLTATGNPN